MSLKKIAISILGLLTFGLSVAAQTPIDLDDNSEVDSPELDIPEQVLEESPTLQKWLEQTPNILHEIRHEPSFRTRLGLSFVDFPEDTVGVKLELKDLFLGNTGLTLSADYQTAFDNDRDSFGVDLNYFPLPLGGFVNLAPVVGYRTLNQPEFETDGINLGLRLLVVLSRTGAADLSLSQSWVNPGDNKETGLFEVEAGYSITKQIRLATGWQRQNSPRDKDSVFSIGLEYLF